MEICKENLLKKQRLSLDDEKEAFMLLHESLRIGEGIDLHLALLDERFAEGDGGFIVTATAERGKRLGGKKRKKVAKNYCIFGRHPVY